jgi:hypothetical protein
MNRRLCLLIALLLLAFASACSANNENNWSEEEQNTNNVEDLNEVEDQDEPVDSQGVSSPPSVSGDWWQPSPKTTWQWQLTDEIDPSFDVDMYDIDLFNTPQATIEQLHMDGRVVICYFSAGTWEDWREDASAFPDSVLGKTMEEWEDERWLDIRAIDLLAPVMQARLDLAIAKGCDGVEPDNVDGYTNNTGFLLSADDQLAFNRWLAEEAHTRGLSVGLKNDLDQIEQLVSVFDWALNEQCFEYNECEMLLPFIQNGKAVFGVEYELEAGEFCGQANEMGLSWMQKNWDLDPWMAACWEQ